MRGPGARAALPALAVLLALAAACFQGRPTRLIEAGWAEEWGSGPVERGARQELPVVRLVNALPMAVDARADSEPVFTAVAPRTLTPYRGVGPDLMPFALFGRSGAAAAGPLAVNREALGRGRRYTIVAMPEENGVGARLRVLRDAVSPDPTHARIRLIHAAAGAGALDVGEAGASTALFEQVSYATDAGFRSVEPGPTALEVTRAGRHVRLLTVDDLRLEPGKSYTIVLVGGAEGRLEALTFQDRVELGPTDLSISR